MNVASFISGKSRALDLKVNADELVTEDDVVDAPKLARLLTRMLKNIADARRRFAPRRTDFEDLDVGAGTAHRLPHGFGGRVRWWVVDASAAPSLAKSSDTDADTLVLTSAIACRITLRVEEAG